MVPAIGVAFAEVCIGLHALNGGHLLHVVRLEGTFHCILASGPPLQPMPPLSLANGLAMSCLTFW